MKAKSNITESEKALFRKTVEKVKPITHSKSTLPRPRIKPKKAPEPDLIKVELDLSDNENLPIIKSNDYIQFKRSGIQQKIIRKLKSGQYNSEAILDLHGKTAEEAKQALIAFLSHCQQRNMRHLLIIHGKGLSTDRPVLKNKLNSWLRQIEDVLAFCSATRKEGHAGALYVLLKNRNITREGK